MLQTKELHQALLLHMLDSNMEAAECLRRASKGVHDELMECFVEFLTIMSERKGRDFVDGHNRFRTLRSKINEQLRAVFPHSEPCTGACGSKREESCGICAFVPKVYAVMHALRKDPNYIQQHISDHEKDNPLLYRRFASNWLGKMEPRVREWGRDFRESGIDDKDAIGRLADIKICFLMVLKFEIVFHSIRSAGVGHHCPHPPEILNWCLRVTTFVRLFAKYFGGGEQNHFGPWGPFFEIYGFFSRAYTNSVRGLPAEAYNDYCHAERELAALEGRFGEANCPDERIRKMAADYVCMLTPTILFHKGELYRKQYANSSALRLYLDGISRLNTALGKLPNDDDWKPPKDRAREPYGNLYRRGLGRVKALLNIGKIYLDLGEFRRALKFFLRGLSWTLYVEGKSRDGVCDDEFLNCARSLDDHLHATKFEPEIDKIRLCERIGGILVNVSHRAQNVELLSKLASDACNRVGAVLSLIRVDRHCEAAPVSAAQEERCEVCSSLGKPEGGWHGAFPTMGMRWTGLSLQFDETNWMALVNQVAYPTLLALEEDVPLPVYKRLVGGWLQKTQEQIIQGPRLSDVPEQMERFARVLGSQVVFHVAKKLYDNEGLRKPEERVAAGLLVRFLAYTGGLARRQMETFEYLCKPGQLRSGNSDDRNGNTVEKTGLFSDTGNVYLVVLRRWSSFTPVIPRPSIADCKGGGFLLVTNGRGVAIDPGFDFVENLYSEGFSLEDIDAIVVTHDHIDHCGNFDHLLTLLHERRRVLGQKKKEAPVELVLSPGMITRYPPLMLQTIKDVATPRALDERHPVELGKDFGFCTISATPCCHQAFSPGGTTKGLIFSWPSEDVGNDGSDKRAKGETTEFRIGYTSDTALYTKGGKSLEQHFADCNVVIANVSSLPVPELLGEAGVELTEDSAKGIARDLCDATEKNTDKINEILVALRYTCEDEEEKQVAPEELISSISRLVRKSVTNKVTLLGKSEGVKDRKQQRPLGDHLLFRGTVEVFNAMLADFQNKRQDKILVLDEFREELGSDRAKLAWHLDNIAKEQMKQREGGEPEAAFRCLAGDIGLTLRVRVKNTGQQDDSTDQNNELHRIQIGCLRCALSNDNLPSEVFHPLFNITQFCIKAQQEGIVYHCTRHNPGRDKRFAQRLDKFKPFEKLAWL